MTAYTTLTGTVLYAVDSHVLYYDPVTHRDTWIPREALHDGSTVKTGDRDIACRSTFCAKKGLS